jgi:hypothetical protein
MKSFLHIGLPKTGTSSLQEWLRVNSASFAEAGFTVVPLMSAHRLAVETLGDAISCRPDIVWIRAQVTLAQALADAAHDRAIISSEYFSLAEPRAVRDLLQEAGIGISKTIAYLRRQDIYCAAGYAQDVKAMGAFEVVTSASYTDALDWTLLRQSWQDVSEVVTVLNYDLHKHDLINSFSHALGVQDIPTIDLKERFNPSLSAELTEVARILNQKQQRFDLQLLEAVKGRHPDIRFGFTAQVTGEFERHYIESNRKLAEMYPEEFSSYAVENWQSPGEDFTGRVSEEHVLEIMLAVRKLEARQSLLRKRRIFVALLRARKTALLARFVIGLRGRRRIREAVKGALARAIR